MIEGSLLIHVVFNIQMNALSAFGPSFLSLVFDLIPPLNVLSMKYILLFVNHDVGGNKYRNCKKCW